MKAKVQKATGLASQFAYIFPTMQTSTAVCIIRERLGEKISAGAERAGQKAATRQIGE
jgi:hypothetical protein